MVEKTTTKAPAAPVKPPRAKREPQEPEGKDKFLRGITAYMASDKIQYYKRGDRVYVDTTGFQQKENNKLMMLEGSEFKSFVLRFAKLNDNVMLRGGDVDMIIEHIQHYALDSAAPLSTDARSAYLGKKMYVNTAWKDEKMIVIDENGTWKIEKVDQKIFEPAAVKMRMAIPVETPAEAFSGLLMDGIADFGDMHCLLSVSCATMLLPGVFSHPFLVFTGDQSRGKSTTMKLLVQLTDPYADGELMSVGEDMRDFIALVRNRHSIALDNVSSLPFDEDLLSKMYSGGLFAARKMTTNSEISEVDIPRLRVMLNGIGTMFSRSDLMSRCIFIEHPILTTKDAEGKELFQPTFVIEDRWQEMLPKVLGSMLSAIGAGLMLFNARGGYAGKTSGSRFVEYCVIGECISEAMGFKPGLFTQQVNKAREEEQEGALAADDCAQLVVAYLNGERGGSHELLNWEDKMGDKVAVSAGKAEVMFSSTELYSAVKDLATNRGYAVSQLKWLGSVKSLSNAIMRSAKNISNAGWTFSRIMGGEHKRNFLFKKNINMSTKKT